MRGDEKGARDAGIVADKALGMSWAQIIVKHDVSESTARRAWVDWWAQNKPEMNRNPLDVVQEEIVRYEELIARFSKIMDEAPEASNQIGAGKALMDAQTRMVDLMQATGLLPKHLGTLRYIQDARVIVQVISDVLERHELPLAVAEEIAAGLNAQAALN